MRAPLRHTTTLTMFITLLGSAVPAACQGPSLEARMAPAPKLIDLLGGAEEITLQTLLEGYAKATGRRFLYAQNVARQRALKLESAGETTFVRKDADRIFQGVLRLNGLALVPVGERETALYMVEDAWASRVLKSAARPLACTRLEEMRSKPAEVVMTVVRLAHAPATQVRQALSQLVQQRTVEMVGQVQAPSAVVLCGFGPTVANMVEVARMLDVPAAGQTAPTASSGRTTGRAARPGTRSTRGGRKRAGEADRIEVVALQYMSAQEASGILSRLIKTRVRIVPDQRTNSLILSGGRSDLRHAREVLAVLDVPAPKRTGKARSGRSGGGNRQRGQQERRTRL